MSRDGHTAFLRSVLELPVAALLYHQAPVLDHANLGFIFL
jgi:hypothetical protein